MWKYIVGFFAFIVIFCAIFIPSYYYGACTDVAPMDKHSLVYASGPLDTRDFIKQVAPGAGRFYVGNLNKSYMYPATERTYIISKTGEGDTGTPDFLTAKSKDGNQLEIQVAITFHLLPDNLRQFHEKLGLKYEAWNENGWDLMLSERVRQPIKASFQEEAKKYTAIEAISEKGMMNIADAVGAVIQREIDSYMGGHYIEIGDLSLIDIDVNATVQTAVENVVKTQQDILAAQNRKEAAEIDAQANEILRKSLQGEGGMTAVLQKAVESGKVTFWVLPSDMQLVAPTITP
ncbi:MAG: SPFH domain-containing protein [Methanofastidiosum sp.]|jgi:hypothetical protein